MPMPLLEDGMRYGFKVSIPTFFYAIQEAEKTPGGITGMHWMEGPRGVEFGSLASFISTSLTKKNHLMYLLAINQALPYGGSFVTYGHPGGSAAGDISIIWNDVLN